MPEPIRCAPKPWTEEEREAANRAMDRRMAEPEMAAFLARVIAKLDEEKIHGNA